MPFTVITLSRVPAALRGDLSRWLQEIATGVYVGNLNAALREQIWQRVKEAIGSGEATLSYHKNSELGYDFETWHTDREKIVFDGLPLILLPKKPKSQTKRGFSQARQFHRARQFSKSHKKSMDHFILLDIETDGLDEVKNEIWEIAALKVQVSDLRVLETFQTLIAYPAPLPEAIQKLTGLTTVDLQHGQELKVALRQFLKFVQTAPLVGYNIDFDVKFIRQKLLEEKFCHLKNKTYDVMSLVRQQKSTPGYRLTDALAYFNLPKKQEHRAEADARLTLALLEKLGGWEKLREA